MAEIKKTRYSHDAMIDLIIANPAISQNQIAAEFGYTPGWVSQVFSADAFKERLAQRKAEVVDPVLRASIEEKLEALADTSIKVLLEKLHQTQNMNVAVRALDISTRAMGYGAKQASVQVNNFIAHVPPRSASVDDWRTNYTPVLAPKQEILTNGNKPE